MNTKLKTTSPFRGLVGYGGHLQASGYTVFLVSELRRYGRRDRPLLVCLPWSVHRQMMLTELRAADKDLGLYGKVVYLDVDGQEMKPEADRSADAAPEADPVRVARGLTSLRRYMTAQTRGRVLIGGRRTGFQGSMPGLVEEALVALEANQPLFLAGGFGGITLDMIRAVEPSFAEWLPPFAGAPQPDARADKSIEAMVAAASGQGWRCFNNGLSVDECRQLAATHRPSEIATLVSVGLGRLAGASTVPKA